jgi:methionyl-tRNA formyltransferase
VRALDLLEAGEAHFRPQDPARATYARKIGKEAGSIDWSRSAREIDRHVRAMTPWPGARTTAPNGREIQILEARVAAASSSAAPGSILATEPELLVAAADGAVAIHVLKPSGGVRMEAAAWLRGARVAAGSRLGA